jgi:hypothetical protein
MMPYERFKVANHERWGLLIKTWATGKDYIGGRPSEPAVAPNDTLPQSTEEFIARLNAAGVNPENTHLLTNVEFVHVESPGHLVIRLAHPDMIAESEADLLGRPSYGLPSFYSNMFIGTPAEKPLTPDEKMKFHAMRIGDYTLSICQ